jgi:hypothetical protein
MQILASCCQGTWVEVTSLCLCLLVGTSVKTIFYVTPAVENLAIEKVSSIISAVTLDA